MTRHAGGTKRSSWLTFRRRLLLVRLLLRGPASSAELVATVQRELGEEGYPANAAAALKHDLDALKAEYGCQIAYRRDLACYAMDDLGELALLDLAPSALEALSFLDASFPRGTAMPELANVRLLLDQVVRLLPTDRQQVVSAQRSAAQLRFPGGIGRIDAATLTTVKRAISERRELQFDYLSNFDSEVPRQHRVAPYQVFFRPEGHAYLDATLLAVTPPAGEMIHAAIDYRIDRIVPGSTRVLPNMLPPERLRPRSYSLTYRLHPNVARRRDVGAYFPDTHIEYHADGSATVTATVTNLWQTRQILLRYGDACQVLAPPELIELFRKTALGLVKLYTSEHPNA